MSLDTDFTTPFYQREDVLLTLGPLASPPPGGVAGWHVTFCLVDPYVEPALIKASVDSTTGVSVLDAALGTWLVPLPAALLDLPAQEYRWELARTDAGAHALLGRGRFPLRESRAAPA